MEKLSVYAVGGLTMTSLLSFVMPNYQYKIQIPENDSRLINESIMILQKVVVL
jgi:carboxymethylenebutenolidase